MKTIKLMVVVLFLTASAYQAKAQKGTLYPNFPESFENGGLAATGYKKKTVDLKSGTWYFWGAGIDSFVNDNPTSGIHAVRMGPNNTRPSYVQMNFDVKSGASKVVLWYSSYATKKDKPCKFSLQYSTDGGRKWKQLGEEIHAVSKVKQAASFDLDVKGDVRFRIQKLPGDGENDPTISNGRLSIDDFAIYKN